MLRLLAGLLCFSLPFPAADLTTQHNDISRTGANLLETTLSPAVLRSGRFGRIASLCVNGQIYAQPLIVGSLDIDGKGVHDVVFVATMENNIYAFDASGASQAPLWSVNVGPGAPYTDIRQSITTFIDTYNIRPWIGITSTPVIDLKARRLFATAKIKESDTIKYKLVSIDISNGRIVKSTEIQVTQNGRPVDKFAFNHLQRPALLLSQGLVYLSFGAHQDPPDQNGWILAYSAETLDQEFAFCTTPGGDGAGIWQAGNGPAADSAGNIYVMTGNGGFNNKDQFGDSFLKLSRDLHVLSWFTPWNQSKLAAIDLDLGSAGPVLLPGTAQLAGGGKEGKLFLLSQDNLGGLQRHSFWRGRVNPPIQFFRGTPGWRLTLTSWIPGLWNEGYHHLHGSPVFWRSSQGAFLYIWGEEDNLKAFRFDPQSHFDPHPIKSKIRAPDGMPGGILSLSANGDHDGVIWAALPLNEDAFIQTVRGVLRAFDATTLEELWNTDAAEPDDNFSFAKYSPPSVVNGKVYLATFSDRLNIYGVRAAAGPPPPISRKKPPRSLHQRRKAEKP